MNFLPRARIVKTVLRALRGLEFGSLRLITPKGAVMNVQGSQPGPHAQVRLRDWGVIERIAARGDIAMGEDYAEGLWECDDVEGLLTLFLMNYTRFESFANGGFFARVGFDLYNRLIRRNSRAGSRRNIEAHYDVGNDFYRLWLDPSMTYSSGLYDGPGGNLEGAQQAKYQRILDRIGERASSVLEIGCGWGGFAEEAAKKIRDVTCLTISPAQHRYATTRLKDKAKILLQDYRDMRSKFDAIVSIEMFEAVGEKYWPSYFKAVAANLKQGGTAVVQTITMRDDLFAGYRKRSDFIRHYVFPGGILPSSQRFREEAEKAGLKCVEMFHFGQDYARTLREWLERFEAKREEILAMGYSESFIRNWRFYLSFCAAAFAVGRTNVMQAELVHN